MSPLLFALLDVQQILFDGLQTERHGMKANNERLMMLSYGWVHLAKADQHEFLRYSSRNLVTMVLNSSYDFCSYCNAFHCFKRGRHIPYLGKI